MDSDQGDSEATRSQSEAETEDEADDDLQAPTARTRQLHRQDSQQLNSRSRATSPSASVPSDSAAADEGYARLTARQRAKLEKEAGVAEDVAWSEMELLPNLTYTWRGKGPKESTQMTEQEWLKRQETLERRRMRSLRDKREAEEAVKAKIRRAVTARFRGKLGPGGDSGLDGQGGPGGDQDGGFVRPGYVKMRYTAQGVSVAWHPAAHPLSLPVPVAAAPCLEPVDLPLQPSRPGEQWQAPPCSSGFRAGCVLALQPGSSAGSAPLQSQTPAGQQPPEQQQQQVLQCVDSQGWSVGCLLQQQVLEALEFAGHWQPQKAAAVLDSQQAATTAAAAAQGPDWQQWRAVVQTIRHTPDKQQLAAVVVRLLPQQQA